jgi:hypothetical protein
MSCLDEMSDQSERVGSAANHALANSGSHEICGQPLAAARNLPINARIAYSHIHIRDGKC